MPTKLGQNFLVNKEIAKNIIESTNLKSDDLVLEIGPGKGALSFEIKKRVKKFIMIEKDRKLAENIARNFQFPIFNFQSISNDQIYKFQNGFGIISGDILELDIVKIIKENNFQNYKVIANLPYYITSPIIRKFLEAENPPSKMILMVQKEVAERIVSNPGKMSILAVSVQYYARPEILFYVEKENFDPVPEVDSAVIKITSHKQPAYRSGRHATGNKEYNKKFFQVVRAGFCAKRKTLANNLANSFHLEKEKVEDILLKAGFSNKVRAQELSVEDWKKLSKLFKER